MSDFVRLLSVRSYCLKVPISVLMIYFGKDSCNCRNVLIYTHLKHEDVYVWRALSACNSSCAISRDPFREPECRAVDEIFVESSNERSYG